MTGIGWMHPVRCPVPGRRPLAGLIKHLLILYQRGLILGGQFRNNRLPLPDIPFPLVTLLVPLLGQIEWLG